MNRLDFTKLVAALKGGSLKGVGFQPAKPGNFDGIRDKKVVDACGLQKWRSTFMPPRLGNI
jgi:hypothetical protein